MTFSIAARCPETGMLGVAVSTAVPAVGSVCPFVARGVGAVATQAWVNPYLGIDSLGLLAADVAPEEVIERLMESDPGSAMRQLGVVNARGESAAYSGSDCVDYFGHFNGPNYSIQGNMLTGEETLTAMVDDFAATSADALPERLISALEAGQAVGGDKRGRQSAAMAVYHLEEYPYLDLRVDEHVEPVAELRRVFEVWQRQMKPFVAMMPSREDPIGAHDQAVVDFIMLSPEQRSRQD